MKAKRWLNRISTVACLAILLSMLLVGAPLPKADAATASGPDAAAAYMYKYVHKAANFNSGYDKMFYLPARDSDVVFREGDVYRLSFYYNIDDATYFPGQHDSRLPLDFGIGAVSGSPQDKVFILGKAAKKGVWASADPQWNYITYDFTISAGNGYAALVDKALDYFTVSPQYFGGTETVYLADIRLCPVVDGAAGASVISGICAKDTLQDWGYISTSSWQVESLQTATSREATCYGFSVLPYDASLFRRPDTDSMLRLSRKDKSGESSLYFTGTQSVTFRAGDVYRLSFRYKMNDGSKFLTGGNPYSPFAIGLFHSGGKTVKLICDTVAANTQLQPSIDAGWNEIVYEYTVPESLAGLQLLKVSIITPYYGSTDEIYLANLRLCPVADGVIGDSLIPTISRDTDLSAWCTSYDGNSSVGRVTQYENDYFTVSVQPYDDSLFRRPVAEVQGAQIRSGSTNDLRFGFAVHCQGVTRDDATYVGDWTSGTVTVDGADYPILEAGAVVQIAAQVTDVLTLETGLDVPAVKLRQITDATVYYTAVVTDIPDSRTDTDIMARPYIVYEKEGQPVIVYGETIVRSYNQVK